MVETAYITSSFLLRGIHSLIWFKAKPLLFLLLISPSLLLFFLLILSIFLILIPHHLLAWILHFGSLVLHSIEHLISPTSPHTACQIVLDAHSLSPTSPISIEKKEYPESCLIYRAARSSRSSIRILLWMSDTTWPRNWDKAHMVSFGRCLVSCPPTCFLRIFADRSLVSSSATNTQTGDGVAIKKVTNVFSKKILAKRALREIKLLQHFRGHRNVCRVS